MEFEYFKLNRNRQIVKRMTIDLDDYIAVLSTGYSWKLTRQTTFKVAPSIHSETVNTAYAIVKAVNFT